MTYLLNPFTGELDYYEAVSTGAEIVTLLEALAAGSRLSHDDGLSDVSADDHHAQSHGLDSAYHTVAGLTTGHFLKATGATTFAFAAHGLTYSDVGAEQSGVSVLESDYGAQTILRATTNNTPTALTVTEQTLVGRITSGNIAALSATQVRTLLNVEDGSTADQTEAEILTLLGLTSVEVDQVGNIAATTISAGQWAVLGGLAATLTSTELNYVDGVTSAIQTQLDARCLESVFGTSIGTGLLLTTTVLSVSTVLQVYHGINPSADVQSVLGCADEAAIRTFLDLESGTDFYSVSALDTALALKAPLASPTFTTKITISHTASPSIEIYENNNETGKMGSVRWLSLDANDNSQEYAQIRGHKVTVTDGGEDGRLEFYTAKDGTITKQLSIDENGLATFVGPITIPATNFTIGSTTFSETQLGDLTDGGDTALHDHDGISENTAARHAAVTLNASATTGGLGLSTQEITFRAATNAQTGYATAAHITAIEANSAKVTCNFANVQTALAAASGAVAFNSQALTGVGAIGCGTVTSTGNLVIADAGNIGSASDTDSIAISAIGDVTFTQDIICDRIRSSEAGGVRIGGYDVTYTAQDTGDYTEEDPSSTITLDSATKVSWASLTRNEDAYVYKDFTADYFDGDFRHEFEAKQTAGDNDGQAYIWMLANLVDDGQGIDDASGDFLGIRITDIAGAPQFYLFECDGGTQYNDSVALVEGTLYYLTVVRDESIGTYGSLYCYIYSDSARTVLVKKLELTLHTSKKDFRYLYWLNSRNTTSVETHSGYTQNLKISTDPFGIEKGIYVHDDGTVDMVMQSGCSVKLSANQTINNITLTALALDTKIWDHQNEWNVATYRFTATKRGTYLATTIIAMTNLSINTCLYAYFEKNGAAMGAFSRIYLHGADYDPSNTISAIFTLEINDYLEVVLHHNSGVAEVAGTTNYANVLHIAKIA